MKNMRSGFAVVLGFGMVILIICVLAGISVFNMNVIIEDATRVSEEYTPVAMIISDLVDSTFLSIGAWESYAFSRDPVFLEKGKRLLVEIDKYLTEAKVYGEKFPNFVLLNKSLLECMAQVKKLRELALETEKGVNLQNEFATNQSVACGELIRQANDYLCSQHETMIEEFSESASFWHFSNRLQKITQITEIIALAHEGRVKFWNALSAQDTYILEEALELIPKITALLDALQKGTRLEVNLRQIEAVREATQGYKNSIEGSLAIWTRLAEIHSQRTQANEILLELASGVSDSVKAENDRIVQGARTTRYVLVSGLILVVIISVLVTLFLTNSVTRPVDKRVRFAQTIAAGNLSAEELSVLLDSGDLQGPAERDMEEMITADPSELDCTINAQEPNSQSCTDRYAPNLSHLSLT